MSLFTKNFTLTVDTNQKRFTIYYGPNIYESWEGTLIIHGGNGDPPSRIIEHKSDEDLDILLDQLTNSAYNYFRRHLTIEYKEL